MKSNLMKYTLSSAFLISAMLLAISAGSVSVPISEIIKIIGSEVFYLPIDNNVDSMYVSIVYDIRLPRVILAGFVGASLAIAGAAFQGLLRNPLADPYILGVSSGASVGAVSTLFFNISIPFLGMYTLPFLSILTALATIMIVLFFAKKIDKTMRVESIILTGVIFSSFLGSAVSLIIALTGEELQQIMGWLLGSVSMRGWRYVGIILPFLLVGGLLLLINTRELNAMSLGEDRAQHLGVDVGKRKMLILMSGSILTGAAVAVSGTIGFVGLVIPHLTRKLWGPDHIYLLPLSIITGAGFLILTDLLSRTIISPQVLPVGVITALVGAPVFAMILVRQRKRR
ncbi:FecCD family ABC transporter permease [Tetragenococcus halophilus]|uniref:FecCD family ABC transporter permease n=1 Tax=Tetragenococcus halophilus TaxID=51669 RepID=UPI001F383896|nr:iron ABC transporter permease [Tetragenococcus halophilus]MCF1601971.1 iron ABC transporter permease [Tetragenococcus halophilus]MCO8288953.1 iron ABC transporter permease [Tetragenococcus halophilus]